MRLKIYITVFVLFSFLGQNSLKAQNDILNARQNELGINLTAFYKPLLKINYKYKLNYLLTYKRVNKSGTGALRVGVGIWNDTPSRLSNFYSSVQTYDFRVGYERRRALGTRFQYFIGGDGIMSSENATTPNTRANITSGLTIGTKDISILGLGLAAGFQLAVTNRFLVGYELLLYMYRIQEKTPVNLQSSRLETKSSTERQLRPQITAVLKF